MNLIKNNMQDPKELNSSELNQVNAGFATYGDSYDFSKGDAFSNFPHFFIVQDTYTGVGPDHKILCDEYRYNDNGEEEYIGPCWKTAFFLGDECVPMH